MKKNLILLSLILTLGLVFVSCEKCVDYPLICEDILKSVTVNIESSHDSSISFDEIYTLRVSTGEKIINPRNSTPIDGVYVVLDDSYEPNLRNQADHFKLIGVKAGVNVFEEPFELYGDGCHVGKRTGKDIIIID